MAAVKGISKLSGQAKTNTYPQAEGLLGDQMLMYGKRLGDENIFGKFLVYMCQLACYIDVAQRDREKLIFIGQTLVEFGDALKQMADVKYALDDNVKQNFLEPLHALQTKDLKEVMVSQTAACV